MTVDDYSRTPVWKEDIDARGFAIIPQGLRITDLEDLPEQLEGSGVERSRAGVRNALKHVSAVRVVTDPRMMSIARDVLGDQAFPFRATLFDKSPKSNWLVVWHQDTSLPVRERRHTSGGGSWSLKNGVMYGHSSGKSLSDAPRRVLHIEYAACREFDGLELAVA